MADEKQTAGQEKLVFPEEPGPESPGTAPGDVVVDTNTIDELMKKRNAEKRAAIEQEEAAGTSPTPEEPAPGVDGREPLGKTGAELAEEEKKPRRGRPPKEAAEQTGPEGDKKPEKKAPRKGRPPKADKAAPDKAAKPVRDKVSQSKKAPAKGGAAKETAPEPTPPPDPASIPRPVEQGQVVYLKLAELHPFHTFREHPYKVQDDDKMTELVGTIKEHGVMTPATVRPEKDGSGYEVIAGHRRRHGSELAGLEDMPCIIREMTDIEAVKEMKNSNKQRGDPLPSELARLLDLEVEAIKHQGGALEGVAEGDIGKRSTEIVGQNNGMNYKKVMRYIRLNSLVPDLLDRVDAKKMGFMPAVELSYIKPKNQRLIAVSIEGEQASPSLSQAQKLRELDKEGKLNGDVIDGILSQDKKEVDKVIISAVELNEFFDKTATPREMKDKIMALLKEDKAKQPPEHVKPEKKADKEK